MIPPYNPPLRGLDNAGTLSRSESGGESAEPTRSCLEPTVSSKCLSVTPLMSAPRASEVQR